MKEEVVIISPELKPGLGGLADYTLRLVEAWGDRATARFVLPADLVGSLSLGEKVLLQYSAYGFDRHGYPRRFLRALLNWKRERKGLLVVMFHEIWTFWPRLNKNHLLQQLHRGDIGKLVSVADAVFTSTPSQAEHLLALVPTCAVQVLPVGSNVRPLASFGARETGLAILFGLQTSRLRTLRKMGDDLRSLVASKRIQKVITVGEGRAADEEERALLSGVPFEIGGALPENEISKLLARASFGISAQDELSLHKSGTFMAYAAHGLNVLSPYADAMAPEPLCWLTHPRELIAGIAPEEREARAKNLWSWQERTSSWGEIANRFAQALQLTGAS